MKLRQALKVLCKEANGIKRYRSTTYYKACNRSEKYHARKRNYLPMIKGKTLYLPEQPSVEMFREMREIYDKEVIARFNIPKQILESGDTNYSSAKFNMRFLK